MPLFKTLLHPTDFDEPSKEAFRVALSLAQIVGARVVVFHVVPPPAIINQDGRVVLDLKRPEPIDLWKEYRSLAAASPAVSVQYDVTVGDMAGAKYLLDAMVRELGGDVLVVMGTHGRTGITRFIWGNRAEEVVRDSPCPVLVIKAAAGAATPPAAGRGSGG